MTEYVPLYAPGKRFTARTSAAVTGGGLVYVSGSGTVANTGSATNLPIGAAATDALSGDYVGVYGRGAVHRLTAAGAITAGAAVESGTVAGTVAAHAIGTNDARVFGIALTTAIDGASVEVMEI